MIDITEKKIKLSKRLLIILAAVFVLILLIAGEEIALAKRIHPGVKVGSIKLGLKTPAEALKLVQQQTDIFMQKGISITGEEKTVLISPIVIAPTDPDLSYEILSFDNEKTMAKALAVGRDKNLLINLKDRLLALLGKKQISIAFNIDEMEFERIMKDNFAKLENPAQQAELIFDENFQPQITLESSGQAFDYNLALMEIRLNAARLENQPVKLILKNDLPTIKKKESGQAIEEVPLVLDLAPIILKYEHQKYSWLNRQWVIERPLLRSWLKLNLNNSNWISLSLKEEEVTTWLAEITKVINIEPLDAKFSIENGRVIEFQASRDGEEVDLEKTYQELVDKIVKEKKSEALVVVKSTLAKITTGDVNDMGIKEMVGRGVSDFSGSPRNRRHNIATGAATLNGILIAPEEEFSLNQAIGKVNAATGYLPELVIKGNETIPEYGGGLCQIGTTTFRLALDAGLPITERKNHSYRVSYYEPAGTDATIYSPYPDVKFVNDTSTHLLMQTRIEGNELIFEFYGTPDGRQVEQTKPIIFNYVRPGPTKIIETLDLAPGEKKCTERAHTGADTEFTRKIIYANGEEKEEVWASHYRPWQEVCLLGVEKLTQKTEEKAENNNITEE